MSDPLDYTVYCYLRISTGKQELGGNKSELLLKVNELGLNSQKVFWIEETISGTKHWKSPKRLLGQVEFKKGDYFITSEISRIGRKMIDIMEFIAEALKKGVNVIFTKTDFKVDDSISSQMMVFAFSIASQIERNLISERTKTILAQKKKDGVTLGRKRCMVLDDKALEIKKLYDDGFKISSIAKKYNSSRATIGKLLKKHNIKVKKN